MPLRHLKISIDSFKAPTLVKRYSNRQGGYGVKLKKSLIHCAVYPIARPMPKPYSYDLRQKVIQAIKLDGLKISEVSILFSISCNTISLWLKRQTETGNFLALPNQPRGNGHKITDWEKFREFAETHGDKTQVEMASLWDGEISDRTISRALKKIGFTRKKRLTATGSVMKSKGRLL
jgi:transposase